jgi:hypothetical protein
MERKVEPSPREGLLTLVRERCSLMSPPPKLAEGILYWRALRALEVLASCSPLMVIPDDVAHEALRILRGEL